jgi:hypothetical protein
MNWRRLLLGDWGRVVRDPLDVTRLAYLAGTLFYALQGRTTAGGLAAAFVLLVVVRLIDLPRPLDLALIVALTLIAWGTALGLYGRYYYYDNLVHALAPLCYAPVLYVVLIRLGVLPDLENRHEPHRQLGVFIVTLAIGMAVTAAYEVVEWVSDSTLGTALVHSADDTGSDLLAGTIGSTIGAGVLVAWSALGFSTTRRPGETRGRYGAGGRAAARSSRPSSGSVERAATAGTVGSTNPQKR